jgi:hypothetical protein
VIVNLATAAVIVLSACIVLLMIPDEGAGEFYYFYTGPDMHGTGSNMLLAVLKELGSAWTELVNEFGPMSYLYALEFVVLGCLGLFMNSLLIYFSITVGATVAKKQKILASVGIYYGTNMAVTFVQQLGFIFMMAWAVMGLGIHMEGLSAMEQEAAFMTVFIPMVALLLLIWILFCAIVSTILAYASLGTLERKLNLQ